MIMMREYEGDVFGVSMFVSCEKGGFSVRFFSSLGVVGTCG